MLNTGAKDIATQALVLSAAVVLCSIVETTLAATNKAKLCFKGSEVDPNGNITLTCPDNQVITIDEALFGRSKWLLCVISDGDCVEKTKIFHECENRNNCSRTFKTYSTKCGYASVMFISYTCLQVDPITVYTSTSTSTYAIVPATKKADVSGGSQVHYSGKSSGLVNRESGSSPTETGLIAGCVVAAVVTVIFLVIAITMVVRRLMQKNNPDDDDDAEADSVEPKMYTCCACVSCFSHIRNCLSYHENKHDFKAAKMTTNAAVVSPTNKQVSVNHKPSTEATDNSLNFTDTKDQVSSDDRIISIQTVAEDNQLDSNSNSRMKNIAKENSGRYNGSENSPLVKDILNEDINSMNKQQNCTVPDNIYSEIAEDAQENNSSLKEKPNSTATGLSEEQQTPVGNKDQTHSGNHPIYDAVAIPNTEQNTIC